MLQIFAFASTVCHLRQKWNGNENTLQIQSVIPDKESSKCKFISHLFWSVWWCNKHVYEQLKITNCTYKEVTREKYLCISFTLGLSVSWICSDKKNKHMKQIVALFSKIVEGRMYICLIDSFWSFQQWFYTQGIPMSLFIKFFEQKKKWRKRMVLAS